MSINSREFPCNYAAQKKYYDETKLRLYHDVHHKAYINGINKTEGKLVEDSDEEDLGLIRYWERKLSFPSSSYSLNGLPWLNMHAGGDGSALGILADRIIKDFGSFDNFKKHFTAAADAIEGAGWTILVWSPYFEELEILQTENHQNLSQWGVIPLLAGYVWENDYFNKDQNKRMNLFKAWWNLVDWNDVLKRFEDNAYTVKW